MFPQMFPAEISRMFHDYFPAKHLALKHGLLGSDVSCIFRRETSDFVSSVARDKVEKFQAMMGLVTSGGCVE